jgi:hypothetical protein
MAQAGASKQRPIRRGALERLRRLVDYVRLRPRLSESAPPYGPLTVGGLIRQLQRFEPTMRVIMPGDIEDWTDVHEAHLDIFSPQRRHPQLLELADDGDPQGILMVRLFGAPDID